MKLSESAINERRAAIIVELFLQDLNPSFAAKPAEDIGYDFFIGFPNDKGGISNYVVQVKATTHPVPSQFPIKKSHYERLSHSNIPALLLVVDVKRNQIFYAWLPSKDIERHREIDNNIMVPVKEVDDAMKEELRRQLEGEVKHLSLSESVEEQMIESIITTPKIDKQIDGSNEIEGKKMILSALLEEFKFRSQELINLQNENNRWMAIYTSAITFVIGWVLTNDKANDLEVFLRANSGRNAFFIISLAVINSIYTFSLAFKGYQIQQVGLFLFEALGKKIEAITGQPVVCLDAWRRIVFQSPKQIGKPEGIRKFYYSIISLLPLAVSAGILWMYGKYVWEIYSWRSAINLYFFFALLMVLLSLILSVMTGTVTNKRWVNAIRKQTIIKEYQGE